MAVASVRGVVWEWQRDDGGYSPYYPEVIQAIENALTNGQKTLNLGTASKSLTPYKVDLVKKEQIRAETGMVRDIRRSEICISGIPCHGLWEWQDGSNNFNIYTITAIIEIEEAYILKQPSVDLSVKPSRLPYTIDFTTMYQTRHHFNTMRKIRRTSLPKPLQSYLTNDTSSLTSGTTRNFALENSVHGGSSAVPNGHLLSSTPGSVYTASLSSVYPSLSSSTTSTSASSRVASFDTTRYKTPQLSSLYSTPRVEPNLHSATTTTSTHASSSPSKGRRGESSKKASANVASRSSGRAKTRSASTNVTTGSTDRTTSKSAKRCKTKVKRPAANG